MSNLKQENVMKFYEIKYTREAQKEQHWLVKLWNEMLKVQEV